MTELDWKDPSGWPDDAQRDRLIGDWHIYQRKGGHRTSTDDLITAWYAAHRSAGRPQRYLDLGCGIGSVLLMVCHRLRPERAIGVEAQAQSVEMARRSIAELPSSEQAIEVIHSDFRELSNRQERFDLITGSPPYFPLDAGVLPADPQRRACRFEARGGVEAYIETAAGMLSDDGRFYCVFQTRWLNRAHAASRRHGLQLTGQVDFHMRTDRTEPFLSVFELAKEPSELVHHASLAVRSEDGSITAEYERVRRELGVASSSC